MPLLDHFRAPLFPRHPWESLHAAWANAIMERLNDVLPPRYFAAVQVHLGSRVEADVAEFDRRNDEEPGANGPAGGVALATWAPPAATAVLDAVFPDDIEVHVLDTRDGAVLVAAVELVSPGNKDRAEARRAFAAKCAAYVQRGVGLVVADIVTSRRANLHRDFVDLLGQPQAPDLSAASDLYAAAYRPAHRQGRNQIDVWAFPLSVGSDLPVLPLALRGAGCVPLDLESTYALACARSRLG